MTQEECYCFYQPKTLHTVTLPVEFLTTQVFLADEVACRALWDLVSGYFRTRSKFLAIWPNVRYIALHRDIQQSVNGLLLVSASVNWQIDYVVVRPECRGQGIAKALLLSTLNHAFLKRVPYVMLTTRPSLRPFYQSCGFQVVANSLSENQL